MKSLRGFIVVFLAVSTVGFTAYIWLAGDHEKDIVDEPTEWAESAVSESALMELADQERNTGPEETELSMGSGRNVDQAGIRTESNESPVTPTSTERAQPELSASPENDLKVVTGALNDIRLRGESGDYIAALQGKLLNDVEADRLDEEASRQIDEFLEAATKEGRFPASYYDALDSVVCTTALCEVTFDLGDDLAFFGIGRGLQSVLKQGEFEFAVISSGPNPDDESLFVSYVVRPGMIDFVEQRSDGSWALRNEQ